jgi:hypothetical protein
MPDLPMVHFSSPATVILGARPEDPWRPIASGWMDPRIKSEDDGGWGNIVLETSTADAHG